MFDIRDEDISEAEARKRLSTYIVIRIEKSANPYDVDDEGNPVRPTWEKASHMIQRDMSQQEARRKVRELNNETRSVTDKKNELSSALQRQLDYAWNRLEDTEGDPRFVYTLAQLDWKLKRVGSSRDKHKKHDKRSKEKNNKKKSSKERHRSKERSSRSKPKKERVSVTAYFKREPARNENCVRMLKSQQMDGRSNESQSHSERLPMAMPAQPPRPAAHVHPSPPQSRPHTFEAQVQCRFPFHQPSNSLVNTHPPPPSPPPPSSSLPVRTLPRSLPENSSMVPLPNASRNNSNIPRAIEEQNRRIQLNNPPRIERQGTTGSQNSRSSVTSFSSLSTEDSDNNYPTPSSSVEHGFHHHERRRGRSRHRQPRMEDESRGLEVAHRQRPRDSADRFDGVPPPAPDPVNAVPEAEIRRRREQRAYRDGDGMRDEHVSATSASTRAPSSRRPRIIQDPPENRRSSFYHASNNYALGSEDVDQLGDRLSRASLANEPRSRQEAARDPAVYYEYKGPPRRYRDDSEDGFLMPGSSRNTWNRSDAQRYMTSRKRTDQDAWDLGTSAPLRYAEDERKAGYTGYRR